MGTAKVTKEKINKDFMPIQKSQKKNGQKEKLKTEYIAELTAHGKFINNSRGKKLE